ncbi:MAG: cache domain-containing protein [Spirochaetales bacterium]|nr:cache domain-containing protein [Spirochaetales bacterium]
MNTASKKYHSLYSRIILSITGTVILLILIMTLFFGTWMKNSLINTLDDNSRNILEATKIHVENLHRGLSYYEDSLISKRKLDIRNNDYIAYSIITNAWNSYKSGSVDEETARNQAISYLRNIRYDNDEGYFWITTADLPVPKMLMHPYYPELEGQILDAPEYNTALGTDKNLFTAAVEVCLADGEGYIDYIWSKPGSEDPSGLFQKLSFVKYFEPWNLIIGTGLYLDDVQADIETRMSLNIDDLNQLIIRQKIGESGYIFIFDSDYKLLVHPLIAGTDGRNLINPETGDSLLDEMIESLSQSDGYFEYIWEKPGAEGEFRFRKKAFITSYPPLGWYICSTTYMDDVDESVSIMLKSFSIIASVFILISIFLSLLVSRNITNQLSAIIKKIKKTDQTGIPMAYVPDSRLTELHFLSEVINNMLDSIKDSRAELRRERDFSLRIITDAPYIITSVKMDGTTAFINKRGQEVTGYSNSEFLDKKWIENFHPRENKNLFELLLKELTVKEIEDKELILTARNGEDKTIVWSSMTRRNDNKEIIEIIFFGRDVSKRKEAEEALRKSEKRAHLLLNIIPDLLFIISDEGIFIDYESNNREFYINYDFHQKSVEELLPPDVAELTVQKVQEALKTGEIVEYIYTLMNPQKERMHFEARMIPSGTNEVLAIVRDVTDKKRMQEMMVQSEKMLSVGGLAAGMAHEINNPLAGMLQTSNVLATRLNEINIPANIKAAEKVGTTMEIVHAFMKSRGIFRMLENISESGIRIAEIVENMLSFARKSDDSTSTYSIPVLMDKTIELAATDFDLKKHYDFKLIQIIREYSNSLTEVPCQPGKIQQVFLNILSNSAQALREANVDNPMMKIKIYEDHEKRIIIIEIEDNGPGMTEETRKRIFEPFFTTKPVGTGTGLGLSVSYFIIKENHGGDMNVQSTPGDGCKFIISLPIDRGEVIEKY